jgi:hypothetical protein
MATATLANRVSMKNIQVIDRADNCTYSIFAATDEEFESLFPNGTDIEFVEDFVGRAGEETAGQITGELWKRPVRKDSASGIHGTLFYQLTQKKRYYPTKKESEMVPLGID